MTVALIHPTAGLCDLIIFFKGLIPQYHYTEERNATSKPQPRISFWANEKIMELGTMGGFLAL